MALWLGVPPSSLPMILPNIGTSTASTAARRYRVFWRESKRRRAEQRRWTAGSCPAPDFDMLILFDLFQASISQEPPTHFNVCVPQVFRMHLYDH
jgi:hypothetical protein